MKKGYLLIGAALLGAWYFFGRSGAAPSFGSFQSSGRNSSYDESTDYGDARSKSDWYLSNIVGRRQH